MLELWVLVFLGHSPLSPRPPKLENKYKKETLKKKLQTLKNILTSCLKSSCLHNTSSQTMFFKVNMLFIFLSHLQKSSINVCLINLLKKHCHKNVTVFLAAFIFSTSIMVFFEIHQKFEGHF